MGAILTFIKDYVLDNIFIEAILYVYTHVWIEQYLYYECMIYTVDLCLIILNN
jgi:hypothetical protein